jgi:hypothetical protein
MSNSSRTSQRFKANKLLEQENANKARSNAEAQSRAQLQANLEKKESNKRNLQERAKAAAERIAARNAATKAAAPNASGTLPFNQKVSNNGPASAASAASIIPSTSGNQNQRKNGSTSVSRNTSRNQTRRGNQNRMNNGSSSALFNVKRNTLRNPNLRNEVRNEVRSQARNELLFAEQKQKKQKLFAEQKQKKQNVLNEIKTKVGRKYNTPNNPNVLEKAKQDAKKRQRERQIIQTAVGKNAMKDWFKEKFPQGIKNYKDLFRLLQTIKDNLHNIKDINKIKDDNKKLYYTKLYNNEDNKLKKYEEEFKNQTDESLQKNDGHKMKLFTELLLVSQLNIDKLKNGINEYLTLQNYVEKEPIIQKKKNEEQKKKNEEQKKKQQAELIQKSKKEFSKSIDKGYIDGIYKMIEDEMKRSSKLLNTDKNKITKIKIDMNAVQSKLDFQNGIYPKDKIELQRIDKAIKEIQNTTKISIIWKNDSIITLMIKEDIDCKDVTKFLIDKDGSYAFIYKMNKKEIEKANKEIGKDNWIAVVCYLKDGKQINTPFTETSLRTTNLYHFLKRKNNNIDNIVNEISFSSNPASSVQERQNIYKKQQEQPQSMNPDPSGLAGGRYKSNTVKRKTNRKYKIQTTRKKYIK